MILSINTGSTSLKYKLFDDDLTTITSDVFSDTEVSGALFKKIVARVSSFKFPANTADRQVSSLKIVHRIVCAGPVFREPTELTSDTLKAIEEYSYLAPLHNPPQLKAINLAHKYFPRAKHYAVFDTGFFKNLPDKAKIYPLPLKFYQKDKIQKMGFHGISHQYATEKAAEILKIAQPNLITLHLGGGASITAIKEGQPIDTSMGWTPMEGLMMWSRAGDIDVGILLSSKLKVQSSKLKFKVQGWNNILNYHSGLKGISNCKNYLDLLDRCKKNDTQAKLAFEMFVYRLQKYIGAYYAALGGKVDAIVFTGKIGAGDPLTKDAVMSGLPFLANIKVMQIEADEEWMMAKLVKSEIPNPNSEKNPNP
jgi:acetate kinase